jgi:hypothetical protein
MCIESETLLVGDSCGRISFVSRNTGRRKISRSSGTSTGRNSRGAYYVLCVKNDGYPSSLDVRKVYRALPDREAKKHGLVRVVDESGEDYLFSSRYFVRLPLPVAARRLLDRA